MPSTHIVISQCKSHYLDNPSEPVENRGRPVGRQFQLPQLNDPLHLQQANRGKFS